MKIASRRVLGPGVVVDYLNTGWETWHQAAVGVNLVAGWNTLRLTHLTRWAEVDYIEVA